MQRAIALHMNMFNPLCYKSNVTLFLFYILYIFLRFRLYFHLRADTVDRKRISAKLSRCERSSINWIALSEVTMIGKAASGLDFEDEMKDTGTVTTAVHEYSIRERLRNAAATIHFEWYATPYVTVHFG